MKYRIIQLTLNISIKNVDDNGVGDKDANKIFDKYPRKISKAMLNPIINNNLLIVSKLFNFIRDIKIKPGKKVNKMIPNNC